MQITIFAKKRTTEDGKPFTIYVARLARKDGSTQSVRVNFRDEAGKPKADKCPCNILVDKANANLTKTDFVREDTGEIGTRYTLWVNAWKDGAPYVDHSLDDFE